jgi:hypothetical protein
VTTLERFLRTNYPLHELPAFLTFHDHQLEAVGQHEESLVAAVVAYSQAIVFSPVGAGFFSARMSKPMDDVGSSKLPRQSLPQCFAQPLTVSQSWT